MKNYQVKPKQPLVTNMATEEQLKKSLEFYEKSLSELRQEGIDRFQRYLDCQDDTLIGGLSDQINNERIREANAKIDIIKSQLRGDVLTNISKVNVHFLITPAGDLVSTRLFNGDYGACFITNELNGIKKFIGAVKRQETYRKKGVICCQGELTLTSAFYLHKDEGFVRMYKYSAIKPVAYNFNKVRASVSITPELEDKVKEVNTQKWVNFYSKKNNQFKY